MAYLIGVDLGTSGTKTVIFDEAGTPLASKTVEYPLYQPQNGWAEQDPLDWWNASVEGMKAVIDPWTEQTGIKPWNPWRVALVGEGQGPDMYELAAFLGKEEVIKRMKFAINSMSN